MRFNALVGMNDEWWMNDEWMRKKGSMIFLKLCTLKVHVKLIFLNFDFKGENFLMGLKFDFEFWNFGKTYKRFPAKKNYEGFLL